MRVVAPLEQCWHEVPGGTARTAIDLTAALHRRDDTEVVGVAARHDGPPDPVWRPEVEVVHSRLPRLALYESWHVLGRPRIESLVGSVDVIHAIGGAIPAGDAPLVVTVHDLAFLHFPELFTRRGNHFFTTALTRTEQRAVQVQVPSRATLRDCVDAGIDESRLRHVPWGCRVGDPQPEAIEAVRHRFDLPERWVVCVGTKEPRKNLPRLLEAWERLDRRDEALVVVGPEGWGDALGVSRVPASVSMTGFVDDATRDALYAGAVASCYPSLFEGFGLPVLESMALGCPVVTSAGTSTEELVADGGGLAVDPTDVDAIAAALAHLLDDDSARGACAAAASRVAGEYTWERAAALARSGYEEVTA